MNTICKGANCSAVDGRHHSLECHAEHNKAVYSGSGNRNPESRYRGYINEQLRKNATEDEKIAWQEGHNARQDA